MGTSTVRYPAELLRHFAEQVFIQFGVSQRDAQQAADVLIAADLRAIDSHGVARLKAYCDLLREGRLNPRPQVRVIRETASTATIDGDHGLGLIVGAAANAVALDKAEQIGTGWVTVCNSNHYGIAGYYVLQAAARGMIGWSMTNSNAMVVPLGGAERKFGTNPIAFAFPAGRQPPIVIDMSTSAVPFGKIEMARRRGESIPDGWGVDGDGRPTNDPAEIVAAGALLPLGSDAQHGGHKGSCLAAVVDMLCCVLSGANWGPYVQPFALNQTMPTRQVGKGLGHFFGAMRIDCFIEPDEFRRQADAWIHEIRSTRPAPGSDGPLIPGDPEREAEAARSHSGIPLIGPVIDELRQLSAQTGVPFDPLE